MLALLALGWTPVVSAKTVVNLGVYYFPPIATVEEDRQVSGLLGDVINSIEAANPDLEFRIVYTSPKRRYLDFDAGLYDVIFFESADWGWSGRDVTISPPLLTDEELYIALKKPGRDQSFFNNIASHRIVALSGYHYRFSGLETTTEELQKTYNIELSNNHSRNMQLILADRPSVAEIAVTSRAYLQKHFENHPEDRDKLLISDAPDYRFNLEIIARKGGPVSADDLYHMLTPMINNGSYGSLAKKWGLALPSSFNPKLPTNQKVAR